MKRLCAKHPFHFRLEYEYIAKGYIFRKGRIKVTVSRVCVKLLFTVLVISIIADLQDW